MWPFNAPYSTRFFVFLAVMGFLSVLFLAITGYMMKERIGNIKAISLPQFTIDKKNLEELLPN